MFDENKYTDESDILMRSILSDAQEEVPAHIWEGISSELDRMEAAGTRKPVVLWFRRSAVAAAAAVAAGVFFGWDKDRDILPYETTREDLIAVVEKPQQAPESPAPTVGITEDAAAQANVLLTDGPAAGYSEIPAADEADLPQEILTEEETIQEAISRNDTDIYIADAGEEARKPSLKTEETAHEYFPEEWPDDDEAGKKSGKRLRTSIVISGTAGTNSISNNTSGLLRKPSMSTARPKTGVEQKSTDATYGLPVSFGAGVSIGLTQRWSLGLGANYTLLTRKFYGTYTLVGENGSVETSVTTDIRNVQQYVGIPVNAYYRIVDTDYLNFYAYAGGTVEKCISDKYEMLNTSYRYAGKASGVQLSANVGIGVGFRLGKHLDLYLDPSLRYYFDCKQPKSIRTAQPLMFGLEMGLRINL